MSKRTIKKLVLTLFICVFAGTTFYLTKTGKVKFSADVVNTPTVIANFGFENGTADWIVSPIQSPASIGVTTETASNGSYSLKLSGDGTSNDMWPAGLDKDGNQTYSCPPTRCESTQFIVKSNPVPITNNSKITVSLSSKMDLLSGNVSYYARQLDQNGNAIGIDDILLGGSGATVASLTTRTVKHRDWYSFQQTFVTNPNARTLSIVIWSKDEPSRNTINGTVFIDNVEIKTQDLTSSIDEGSVIARGTSSNFGMKIESVSENGNIITVKTTGGRFEINKTNSKISAYQTINIDRKNADLTFDQTFDRLHITQQNDEYVIFSNNYGMFFGIYGDSVLLVANKNPFNIFTQGNFSPAYTGYTNNALYLSDDKGGMGIYPLPEKGAINPTSSTLLGITVNASGYSTGPSPNNWQSTHSFIPNQRVILSVFPPRPFNMNKYVNTRITHTGGAYPADEVLQGFSTVANKMILQGDNGSINDSTGPYTPNNPAEYQRVVDTSHRFGMEVMEYIGAGYFASTSKDKLASFIAEAKGLKDLYKVDGFYVDNCLAEYSPLDQNKFLCWEMMREMRSTVGSGTIELNDAGQYGAVSYPFLNTYADYAQLSGEGASPDLYKNYTDSSTAHLRYTMGQYNTSNAVGIMDKIYTSVCLPNSVYVCNDQQIQDIVNFVVNQKSALNWGSFQYVFRNDWQGKYIADPLKPDPDPVFVKFTNTLKNLTISSVSINNLKNYTFKPSYHVTGTKPAEVIKVTVNGVEVTDITATTFSIDIDLPFGQKTITAVGEVASGNKTAPATYTVSRRKPGDGNDDNSVNMSDFAVLMSNWGKTGDSNKADFNEDSAVNMSDFAIMMSNWNK